MLRYIEIENIKAYREPTRVDLAPVTVILGKNSSGKSALLRFPVVVAHSLANRKGPALSLRPERADAGSGIDYAETLLDMAHYRSQSPVRYSAGIGDDGGVECSLIQDPDTGMQIVEHLRLRRGGLTAEWARAERPDKSGVAAYRYNGQTDPRPVRFAAGLPVATALTDEAMTLVDWVRESFIKLKESLFYLGPVRLEPQRSYQLTASPTGLVGPRGEDAAQILAAAMLAQGDKGDLASWVGDWFYRSIGQRFSVRKAPGSPEVALMVRDGAGRAVNLVDTGHGIGQLLPLIVQIGLSAQAGAPDAALYFIEQPESQLHPAAHGDVADALLAVRRADPGRRLVIETHSENLLLRLRRRAIEGKTLTLPELVVYWVEPGDAGSQVRRITFDVNGQPDGWPKGIFAEDYDEVMAIRRALAQRGPA